MYIAGVSLAVNLKSIMSIVSKCGEGRVKAVWKEVRAIYVTPVWIKH